MPNDSDMTQKHFDRWILMHTCFDVKNTILSKHGHLTFRGFIGATCRHLICSNKNRQHSLHKVPYVVFELYLTGAYSRRNPKLRHPGPGWAG